MNRLFCLVPRFTQGFEPFSFKVRQQQIRPITVGPRLYLTVRVPGDCRRRVLAADLVAAWPCSLALEDLSIL